MTRRLYYEDSFCREFEAKVVSCVPAGDPDGKLFEVILDRTAFYPEGGGQPGDKGLLRITGCETGSGPAEGKDGIQGCYDPCALTIQVTDTAARGDDIVHYCSGPLPAGSCVKGEIDWDYRFVLMQNHTGEHIVSGLIHEAFGYDNVGFHMGSDVITIDLNGMLTDEQLRSIELKANEIVWRDVPVMVELFDDESKAESLEYRSKKELEGEVRIVRIPGADLCACCGTHVKRTGQIGPILLLSCQKFRKGVRIEMLCGRKAYDYMASVMEQNHKVSVLLSARPGETGAAVSRMKAQMQEISGKLYEYRLREIERIAGQYEGAGNVVLFCPDMPPEHLCKLAVAVMDTCRGICCTFSGDDEGGYRYAVGKAGGSMKDFVKTLNTRCSGRGGGKPNFAQGSVSCAREEILAVLGELAEGWRISDFNAGSL